MRKVFALHRGHAQVMFLDSNTATASHKARTHGPGWRTEHASSIDENGLIYIPKATSAPPRAGTTGIILYCIILFYFICYNLWYVYIYISYKNKYRHIYIYLFIYICNIYRSLSLSFIAYTSDTS